MFYKFFLKKRREKERERRREWEKTRKIKDEEKEEGWKGKRRMKESGRGKEKGRKEGGEKECVGIAFTKNTTFLQKLPFAQTL